ncbi:MAG: 2,3-bisphosphoglycerate-independent phosphoglycerate mutase [Bacteroidetes bacterium]|nr:2,3-bisphosphoglycerate-independent phosphoglycerate mutase [Bacteroidota bacterium]
MTKKTALIILDGWGIGNGSKSDAIANANTPFYKDLIKNYPNSTLKTSGKDVGLPHGQMGNSEVGHLNIGAGRIVFQDLEKVNNAIETGVFDENVVINEAFEYALKSNKAVHFMGLLSDGGVHSHQEHLHKLCSMASEKGVRFFVHVFTDGRDTDPKGGYEYVSKLQSHLERVGGKIASLIGRYYAMDRDKRWERIKLAYNLLVKGEGEKTKDILSSIKDAYANNVTDEFIKPLVRVDNSGNPIALIQENDVVFCYNFRTDRCREITQVLTQMDMPEFQMKAMPLHYVTMTKYDATFKKVQVVFDKDDLEMTLGEVLEKNNKTQIRISETEKYPHVTFFFSGGREQEFLGEKRILIPSPKVATYDLQPEMSAMQLTEAILPEFQKAEADFICLNFANADMVGHTGDYNAVVKAVETVDSCLERIVNAGIQSGYSFIIIADHGNADYMVNDDGSPNTAHTTNPVPCILIDKDYKSISNGRLADIAPTILKLMNITPPKQMDGVALV